MLKKLTKDDKPYTYAVIDIETTAKGIPLLCGYYADGIYQQFSTVSALVASINANVVYAHCGMRFDYSLLLREFLRQGNVNVHLCGSQGISMEFVKNGRKILLLDSYRLLPASLRKLTEKFCPELPKLDVGMMPWDMSYDVLAEYLERDCVALYTVIERFWDLMSVYGVKARTLSSLALRIYQRHYMQHDIWSSNGKLYEFERQSYSGGLVYCTKGSYRVWVYDVNSMYPFVMRNMLFPYSYLGGWTRRYRGRLGLYKIMFSTPGIPFIYDCNTRELVNDGEGIVDNKTLDYLAAIGGSYNVSVGYEYFRCDYLFKEFVDDFYAKRQESTEPMKFVYKILLNSLYGKFGQKRERRVLSSVIDNPLEGIVYSVKVGEGLAPYAEVIDKKEKAMVSCSSPVIASFVTLAARRYLHSLTDEYTVYCDTDSIHSLVRRNDLPEGSCLGEVKLEYEGNAVYLGKKLYQFENHTPKCKGIPTASLHGTLFKDIYSPRAFEFDTYPSIVQQVKHGIGFTVLKATRTINV